MIREKGKTWEKVLDFILDFQRLQKRSPKPKDISLGFGITRQRVSQILKFLEEKGHIEFKEKITIRVKR